MVLLLAVELLLDHQHNHNHAHAMEVLRGQSDAPLILWLGQSALADILELLVDR